MGYNKKMQKQFCVPSEKKIKPVFQPNKLMWEHLSRLLNLKQEWTNMSQHFHPQHKLQPASWARRQTWRKCRTRLSASTAVWGRKYLQKFESDRESFFKIMLFLQRVSVQEVRLPAPHNCSLLKRRDGSGWGRATVTRGSCKGTSILSIEGSPAWVTLCFEHRAKRTS